MDDLAYPFRLLKITTRQRAAAPLKALEVRPVGCSKGFKLAVRKRQPHRFPNLQLAHAVQVRQPVPGRVDRALVDSGGGNPGHGGGIPFRKRPEALPRQHDGRAASRGDPSLGVER